MNIERIKMLARQFRDDESGLAAVEYGLLAAGIAVALYTVIGGVGNSLSTIFTTIQDDISAS